MSKKSDNKKGQPTKKRVVVSQKKKVRPTVSRSQAGSTRSARNADKTEFIFGKQNYIFMAAGLGLIFLGMLLMSGGGMDNPNEWKPEVIYGWRRTLLAPMVILAGLAMEVYAIFLDSDSTKVKASETV